MSEPLLMVLPYILMCGLLVVCIVWVLVVVTRERNWERATSQEQDK